MKKKLKKFPSPALTTLIAGFRIPLSARGEPLQPSPDGDRERGIAREFITSAAQEYERDRNPLRAWRAYMEARGAGFAIPPWVFEYFDRAAVALFSRYSTHPPKMPEQIAQAVAEALEFKKPGKSGAANPFRAMIDDRDLIFAIDVKWYLEGGHKEYLAYEYVASKHKVSKSTVSRAWEKYETLIKQDDLSSDDEV